MSYGATVGGSADNINLIEFKKIMFTPVLNKSYLHCDFLKWLIDYLKNAYEFKMCLLLLIFRILHQWTCYRSKSKSLIGLHVNLLSCRGVNSPNFGGSLPQFCRKFRNLPQPFPSPAFRKYNRDDRDFSMFIPV